MNRLRIATIALTLIGLVGLSLPQSAFAAGSITPSGGGSNAVGAVFTITVKASGATFDSLQGLISVSGPVSIVSFSAGGATWLPGKTPENNNQFVGITSPTNSLTVATIKLKGTKTGSGKVTVSGVRLARSGSEVGTGGGTSSFTITPAPTPPGLVSVTSSTHPDPTQSYEASTVELAWTPPSNGADGYAHAFDQAADTVPATKVTTTSISASYPDLAIGTYYFHIRAHNKDGWSDTTHFKVNIKPKTDASLATPAITAIETTSDHTNDITAGTLTGITIKGTGPIGYAIMLAFTPDLALAPDKYPAPEVAADGSWALTITDPIKAGFYTVTATGKKDSIVSSTSPVVAFEISIAEGGRVKMITDGDATVAFKQAQEATRVAAAEAKHKQQLLWGGVGGAVLIALAVILIFFRRKLFSGIKI